MVSKTFMVSMGMIKRSTLYAGLIGAAGLGLAAGLLWLNFSSPAAQGHSAYSKDRFRFQVPGLSLESDDAASIVPGEGQSAQVLYVAPNGDCGVGVDPCFGSVQAAVDAAEAAAAGGPADEIRVAGGVYTDVHQRAGITQVVYLSKTVTIRGGYIAGSLDGSAWTTSYPLTQPTTLDAGGQGRGLYVTGTISATIEGLRITGGYAHQSGDNVQNGGGIAIAGAAVVLKHNRITGNSARFGGGVHLRLGSTATLRENTISLNVADHGGGLAVQDSSLARLENNAITSNIGHQDGGGVYLSGSDAVLDDNTFTSNATTGYGGGIYIYASQARLSRNTLTSNRAARIGDSLAYGGGLAVFNYSDAVLDDNRIASNSADDNGGGI
ncbi:MAG: DUF1565 domain-containing protein, partial [Thermoflexales bacterium]|nr:DUF1565 domain-containing protein [Thermoflexales bacterium]